MKPYQHSRGSGTTPDSAAFSISPKEVMECYSGVLSPDEKKEILKYHEIFFLGTEKSKEKLRFTKVLGRPPALGANNKYHLAIDHNGIFKVIEGDHIAYRYEVLKELGRGAFGQVIKCFDHKTNQQVAVKLNRNDPQLAKSSRIEAEILTLIANMQKDVSNDTCSLVTMH